MEALRLLEVLRGLHPLPQPLELGLDHVRLDVDLQVVDHVRHLVPELPPRRAQPRRPLPVLAEPLPDDVQVVLHPPQAEEVLEQAVVLVEDRRRQQEAQGPLHRVLQRQVVPGVVRRQVDLAPRERLRPRRGRPPEAEGHVPEPVVAVGVALEGGLVLRAADGRRGRRLPRLARQQVVRLQQEGVVEVPLGQQVVVLQRAQVAEQLGVHGEERPEPLRHELLGGLDAALEGQPVERLRPLQALQHPRDGVRVLAREEVGLARRHPRRQRGARPPQDLDRLADEEDPLRHLRPDEARERAPGDLVPVPVPRAPPAVPRDDEELPVPV